MAKTTALTLIKLRNNPVSRGLVRFNNWMVRKNLFGMGRSLMLVEHRGRRSGMRYETTVSYLADADGAWAWTRAGDLSNWYQNCAAAGRARVCIMGRTLDVSASAIASGDDAAEAFAAVCERFGGMRMVFGARRTDSPQKLRAARDRFRFIRFTFR